MWKYFDLSGFLVDYKILVFIHLVKCCQNVISEMWFEKFTGLRTNQRGEFLSYVTQNVVGDRKTLY